MEHTLLPSPSADSSSDMTPKATTSLITDLQMASLLHEHPLVPFTRFASRWCNGCGSFLNDYAEADHNYSRLSGYIYGGYYCKEIECQLDFVFHKECAKPLQEINHSSHPDHSLKLIIQEPYVSPPCSFCGEKFDIGYCCSICDFYLDFPCARRPEPLVLPANRYGHEHPLQLHRDLRPPVQLTYCIACSVHVNPYATHYICNQCDFVIHVDCLDLFPEAYHNSHPQHPLKSLKSQVPPYAYKKCLLCGKKFDEKRHQLHHCDVCNFSICRVCMRNPPPVDVECLTTHEHQLHLVPRLIDFTCNACGTKGDRSPYFCLQCNFMIHRQCIGLPRFININRHDHRISYARRLGHGEWKCRVCREKVDGFYGAYTCIKCPTLAVHSLCAIRRDVWDMIEREGAPEEEDIAPFEVIDDTTIKHFSHDHYLRINNNGHGQSLPESTRCVACVFQICSEPYYSCEQCNFVLHKKCAHLPRKKRHVRDNQLFTLYADDPNTTDMCSLCYREFSGFRYKSGLVTLDVRCGSTSDSLEHESHQHPLYYYSTYDNSNRKSCSQCTNKASYVFGCSACNYFLDGKCALLPKTVTKIRYDDHPLFLCFGEKNAYDGYWCEACETKLDPKKWFYTCNDCGITLHISCVVGDYSYITSYSLSFWDGARFAKVDGLLESNDSICRPLCFVCNSRCNLPTIRKFDKAMEYVYICSYKCSQNFRE